MPKPPRSRDLSEDLGRAPLELTIRVLAYPVEASGLTFFYVNPRMIHASTISVNIPTLSSDGVHAAVRPIIRLDWADPCYPAPRRGCKEVQPNLPPWRLCASILLW